MNKPSFFNGLYQLDKKLDEALRYCEATQVQIQRLNSQDYVPLLDQVTDLKAQLIEARAISARARFVERDIRNRPA